MKLFLFFLVIFLSGHQASAQTDADFSKVSRWQGQSIDHNTNCEITLAPSVSRPEVIYSLLTVNHQRVVLGNVDNGIMEMLKEIPQTVPGVKPEVKLFRTIPSSLANRNLDKNIFLFIDTSGAPKLIKGNIFDPELFSFECGLFYLVSNA